MLVSKEKEVKNIAEKVVKMEPQSIRTLIFAADVLLARDQMEGRGAVGRNMGNDN